MIEAFRLRSNKVKSRDMRIFKKYSIGIILIIFTYLMMMKTTNEWRNQVKVEEDKLDRNVSEI